LIKEWEPAPLIDEKQRRETVEANLGNEDGAPMLVIHSSAGAYVSLSENTVPDYLNLVSTGYLNLQDDKEVLKAAEKTLRDAGVGACGPRGFYGTVDVHLDLEKKMAEFFGTQQSVLYSSGFATISSVIPCFSKANDYLFVDKGISFATQTGVTLARSKTFFFDHNNVKDLEALCEKHVKVFEERAHRVFVVIEGVYFNHADIAPLDKILELKKKYPFRILAEESHSVGVLGKTGRGLTEHFGVPVSSIEIISGSTGNALGANGGFSVGPKEATVHQRLSSSGYVFSCSLPPFVAAAAIVAFNRVATGVEVQRLQTRVKDLADAMKEIRSLTIVHDGLTPVAHLRLAQSTGSRYKDDQLLQQIVDQLRTTKKIIVARSHYVFSEKHTPPPSIRITISSQHTPKDLKTAAKAIEEIASKLLKQEFVATSASSSTAGNKLVIHSDDEDPEEIVEPPASPKKSKKGVALSPKAGRKVTSPKASKAKTSKAKKSK
jgi:serine palmitoyltransferase